MIHVKQAGKGGRPTVSRETSLGLALTAIASS